MSAITAEMKAMIEKEQCFVVTADRSGQPSAAPKGSLVVLDDTTLAYGEGIGGLTYRNLRENPRVAVVVADRAARKAYRFFGVGELRTEGSLFDTFAAKFAQMGLDLKAAVEIRITEIYDLSVAKAGSKVN